MEITKEQDEHKVDHGKVKPNESIDVTTMDQFKKDFKFQVENSYYNWFYKILKEFNDMVEKKILLSFNAFECD